MLNAEFADPHVQQRCRKWQADIQVDESMPVGFTRQPVVIFLLYFSHFCTVFCRNCNCLPWLSRYLLESLHGWEGSGETESFIQHSKNLSITLEAELTKSHCWFIVAMQTQIWCKWSKHRSFPSQKSTVIKKKAQILELASCYRAHVTGIMRQLHGKQVWLQFFLHSLFLFL